jgi:glycine cleavage system H protein
MNVPADLRYTKEHEWVRIDGDVASVGITDFAQDSLGDVVFVELPGVGTLLSPGATFGVVESNKSVSDLFAPLGGEVIAVNERLTERPELVNESPYEAGWMIRIRVADPAEAETLLGAAAYAAHVASEHHG